MECKVCGNATSKKIGELCSNMKIMGLNFKEGNCDIVVCSNCGFVFNQYENSNQSDFDKYYSDNSKTVNYYDIYGKELADEYFEHIYCNIKDYINKDSYILDVAGGYGELSKFLKDKGYENVTMLEMKNDCAQYAETQGIKVIKGNFLHTELDNKFDLIILSNDLEHFIDVDVVLNKVRSALKPNGKLFIEVPNIEEYCKLDRAPYHFLTYEHVCHFSEKTLQNIANVYGFKIMYIKKYVKGDDYPCLYGVWCLNEDKLGIEKECESEASMSLYINKCKSEILTVTEKFEKSQQKLILWGIGASTAQLLNQNFDKCNVIQLIDSNVSRQGIGFTIGGRKLQVEEPTSLKDEEAVILILPTAYKDSIKKSIANYGYTNDVVSLK